MKRKIDVTIEDVKKVYGGAEGRLWELVMGEQIHVGGLASSQDLAQKAEIAPGGRGVDLCCCSGAGMRFLLRFCGVEKMCGVDAAPEMIKLGIRRSAEEGYADSADFVLADVRETGLPDGGFDFVWGEDAWCYVKDKPRLINEAARIVKRGGVIAFTDWMEGPAGLTDNEAERLLSFMKFPSVLCLDEYAALLGDNGCDIALKENTKRFPSYARLYIDMLTKQLTYDALKIIGFNEPLMEMMGEEMIFLEKLAREEKLIQGLIVARKK